jgi:hypothetical protein
MFFLDASPDRPRSLLLNLLFHHSGRTCSPSLSGSKRSMAIAMFRSSGAKIPGLEDGWGHNGQITAAASFLWTRWSGSKRSGSSGMAAVTGRLTLYERQPSTTLNASIRIIEIGGDAQDVTARCSRRWVAYSMHYRAVAICRQGGPGWGQGAPRYLAGIGGHTLAHRRRSGGR